MDGDSLAERFEAERPRLQTVAYRLLGSAGEADDAVQESWLRLSRADTSEVANLSGWLTTVVARVCLDMLRSRRSRREERLTTEGDSIRDATDPEREAMMAESVGLAMLTVLEHLSPAERVSFVLHDVFSVSFDEIAGIVGRTPVAARQLASRGRRRVQQASQERRVPDRDRQRDIVTAFFRASRAGDFQALLALLDPEAVLRPDATALEMGLRSGWITSELQGAEAVAQRFSGQAQGAQVAIVDGLAGGVWASATGVPIVAFVFTTDGDRVVEIELIADPDHLGRMQIEPQT